MWSTSLINESVILLFFWISHFYREPHISFSFIYTLLGYCSFSSVILFCSIPLRFAVIIKEQKFVFIFWKVKKERHYFRRLFLNLCEGSASSTKHKGICYNLILRVVPLKSRSHRVLFRVTRINL
jgi:hypothetical protein